MYSTWVIMMRQIAKKKLKSWRKQSNSGTTVRDSSRKPLLSGQPDHMHPHHPTEHWGELTSKWSPVKPNIRSNLHTCEYSRALSLCQTTFSSDFFQFPSYWRFLFGKYVDWDQFLVISFSFSLFFDWWLLIEKGEDRERDATILLHSKFHLLSAEQNQVYLLKANSTAIKRQTTIAKETPWKWIPEDCRTEVRTTRGSKVPTNSKTGKMLPEKDERKKDIWDIIFVFKECNTVLEKECQEVVEQKCQVEKDFKMLIWHLKN